MSVPETAASPAAAGPPGATRWGVILVVVGAGIVGAMQIGKVPPVMSTLRAELELGMVIGGWMASLIHLVTAAAGLPAGGLVDRLGRYRETLALGLVAMALGNVLGAFAPSETTLVAGRALEALGYLAIAVSGPTLLVRAASGAPQRLAFGMWAAFFPVGMAIAMTAAPPITAALGWRGLWLANAAVLLVFTLLFWIVTGRSRRGDASRPAAPKGGLREIGRVVAAPGPWLLAFSLFAYTSQVLALLTWLPTFFAEALGLSGAAAARFTALVVICQLPGNLGCGWLLARGVPRWSIVACALAVQGCLVLAIFAPGVPAGLKLPLACLLSMTGGLVPAAILAGTAVHAPRPELVGTVNGVVLQVGSLGGLVGPPLLAYAVVTLGGWTQARWALFAVAGAGVALTLALRAAERRLGTGQPARAPTGAQK